MRTMERRVDVVRQHHSIPYAYLAGHKRLPYPHMARTRSMAFVPTSQRLAHHALRPVLMTRRPTHCTIIYELFLWQRAGSPLDRPPSRVYNPAERPRPVG